MFAAEVPLRSNPLNLYDDIHNAFIVNLFSRSDKPCFHILSEFRKSNKRQCFLALAIAYTVSSPRCSSSIFSGTTSIPFHQRLGLP